MRQSVQILEISKLISSRFHSLNQSFISKLWADYFRWVWERLRKAITSRVTRPSFLLSAWKSAVLSGEFS